MPGKEVKILFKFYSDLLEQEMEETIWANAADENLGYYQLDSIPFYVAGLATDDIVHAEYDDEEEILVCRTTLKASGNSTVWVVVLKDTTDVNEVRDIFEELGCLTDAFNDRYFAMEIKAELNYHLIKDRLNQLISDANVVYIEACLSAYHQY